MLPGDRQRALEHIQAKTDRPSLAVRQKRRVAREIVESNLLSTELLRTYSLVYAGSHTDVAFPICLGGRRIQLLDPFFGYLPQVYLVWEQIRQIIHPRTIQQINSRTFAFAFDFGEGLEDVTVRCLPNSYVSDEEMDEADAFRPDGPIGMLLAFNPQKMPLDRNKEVASSLVSGGMIFVNRRDRFVSLDDDQQAEVEAESIMSEEHATRIWLNWIQQAAAQEGEYRFVPLQRQRADFYYTFLQKL